MTESSGSCFSSLPSRVRSKPASSYDSVLRHPQGLRSSLVSSRDGSSALQEIIELIQQQGLHGPLIMLGDKEYLGQGAQFVVYRQRTVWSGTSSGSGFHDDLEVAVKQPKIDLSLSRPAFDIAAREARRHLNHIILEIKALTTPSLQRHENIVNLLSWSYDPRHFHRPFALVLELAWGELARLLAEQGTALSRLDRSLICGQVGSGIDAIHACNMIHGDLRPENVLIFERNGGGYLAKLGDFGLSLGMVDGHSARLGGTAGWQAPEVLQDRTLTAEELVRCDNYSFGLLAWSTIFGNGRPALSSDPKSMAELAAKQSAKFTSSSTQDRKTMTTILSALQLLLHCDIAKRPATVASLFDVIHLHNELVIDHSPGHAEYTDDAFEMEDGDMSDEDELPSSLCWEIPDLPKFFMHGLLSQFEYRPATIPSHDLFALFLCETAYIMHPNIGMRSRKNCANILTVAAQKGYEPAQAMVPAVLEYLGQECPPSVAEKTMEWLEAGVATGSVFAKQRLQVLMPAVLPQALQNFRDLGGYGIHHRDPFCPRLHVVTSYGTISQVRNLFDNEPDLDVDLRTSDNETPLYLACARGSSEIALELLDRGADASVACTAFNITCVHWLFAFDSADQRLILTKLLENGARIDINVPHPVPFFHYPFELPAGTALHWAVSLEAHETIAVLLRAGADPTLRDLSDPYRYDDIVRILDKFGGVDQEPYSVPHGKPTGLSTLDISAANHDPYIFELLHSMGTSYDIHLADDEGHTVLHRLSGGSFKRTRSHIEFSAIPFRGSEDTQKERLQATVLAIKSLQYDLDRLSTPQTRLTPMPGRLKQLDSYTALMMAAKRGLPHVVQSLVDAGAAIDLENSRGETALECFCETKQPATEISRILISAGADITHRARGGTILCTAAHHRNLDVMDLVLAMGADISEKDSDPYSGSEGTNIFAILGDWSGPDSSFPLQEEWDEKLHTLLEKHVLSNIDDDKVSQVVEHPDLQGVTLLYKLAKSGTSRCVQALIRHGTDVNRTSKIWTCREGCAIRRSSVDSATSAQVKRSDLRWHSSEPPEIDYAKDEEGSRFKLKWLETPLDAAIQNRARIDERMRRDATYSISEYNNFCRRADVIIKSLQDAGGVESQKIISRILMPPDLLKGGVESRRMLWNL